MLRAGYRLSDVVTAALCHRWQPGVTLLPVTDDRVETHVVVDDPATGPADRRAIHFQEWWVRHRAAAAGAPLRPGRRRRGDRPAPGRAGRDREADAVLLAAVEPGGEHRRDARGPRDRATRCARPRRRSSGCRPIIGGAPVRGMADACLAAIGVETTAEAVGRHYGAGPSGGLLDGWLVAHRRHRRDVPGVEVRAVPLLMTDVDATAAMARAALDLCGARRWLITAPRGGHRRSCPSRAARVPAGRRPGRSDGGGGALAGRRRRRGGHQQDRLQGRGPARRRARRPRGARRAAPRAGGRRDRAGARPAREDPDRREQARHRAGRGGRRRLATCGRDELALLPADPDASAARLRDRAAAAARRRRRGGRHRHDGPLLAGRPDGRRDRRRPACRCCTATRGAVDARATSCTSPRSRVADELAAAADLVKGKLGGVPVAVVRGLGVRSTTARRPATWSGRSTTTCSALGTDEAHASRAGARPCCCAAASATSPTPRWIPRRCAGPSASALTAPAPHHSTPFRFVLVARRDAHGPAGRDGRAAGARTCEGDGRPPDEVARRMRRGDLLRRAPELVLPFRTGDGMHDYPDEATARGTSGRCSPSPAAPRCSRCWWRSPPRGSGRAGSAPRSSPRTSCARCWACPPTGSRSARSRSACPREPLVAARRRRRAAVTCLGAGVASSRFEAAW